MSIVRPERELVEHLSQMPLSTEDTMATWKPPDWEEVVSGGINLSRITGKTYRFK
jgi:hypothetical protein